MAMTTKEGLITQSFMLTEDDIRFIEVTQRGNGLTNKSAAMRQLLQDASLYQQLKARTGERAKKQVVAEIAGQLAKALAED